MNIIMANDRWRLYKGISTFIDKFKFRLLNLGIAQLIIMPITLASPYFYKILVDDVMVKKQLKMLIWVCVGYLGLYLIESLILLYQTATSNKLYNRITFDIRCRIWKNYVGSPLSFYREYDVGDLKTRIDSDVDLVENYVKDQVVGYIYNYIFVIINGLFLLWINWKLSLFAFAMIPLSFWVAKLIGKGAGRAYGEYRKIWGQYEEWLQGSLQAWKEIKALNIELREQRTFIRYWHKLCKLNFIAHMYWYANDTFAFLKDSFITKMSLYFIGGILIINGNFSIGSLLIFIQYYDKLFSTIEKINQSNMKMHNDMPSLQRVIEMIEYKVDAGSSPDLCPPICGNIVFSKVSFRYEGADRDSLINADFGISQGEKVAIVGKSGSGKSTIVKILLGLNTPSEGNVDIDGVNVGNINPVFLHRNIGVVMQDSIFFNMTIKDNLLLSKPSATDDEIKEACRMAYIEDVIEGLPEGYMTVIGEKGTKLSGGQKQRLAIARALLSKPRIIIFDEATSSLDYEAEKEVLKAIYNIAEKITVIIVAHRLSTISSADRVIVVDDGKIASVGTHKELLGRSGAYDKLFREQYNSLAV